MGCNVVSFSLGRATNVVYQTPFRLIGEQQEVMLIHDPEAHSCFKMQLLKDIRFLASEGTSICFSSVKIVVVLLP